VSVPYHTGDTQIGQRPAPGATVTKVVDLPAGTINHHWTKNLIASSDGSKLYVTIGSNSNAGENGIDKEAGRAAIWEIDLPSGAHRVFASRLRIGLAQPGRHGVGRERCALGFGERARRARKRSRP
jgi:glucose/arabinose dehydrogenase